MPLRVRCERCGAVLYEGTDLKPPYEIIESHNGKCPGCRKKLSHIPITVKIRSVGE
ncbi:MAG: hypothetical protein OEX77_04965 [Candidatus Bathyarchaeota archaeon]|nr:hypothetical protein [Candidatus Bathyarchaeota archaeon]MDH5733618.1 hypothetical protein [Candidatus Bathyarchaeota archaeon]